MFDFIDLTNIDAVVPVLGLTLLLCLIMARVTKAFGIPKVSGFLLLGVLLGPHVTGLFTKELLAKVDYLSNMALGLILFNIGGEFNKYLLRRIRKKVISETALKILIMCSIAFTLFFVAIYSLSSYGLVSSIFISAILTVVSVEVAPPTTMLVLKEYSSKGPLTDAIMIHIAISTGVAIVGTILVMAVAQMTGVVPTSLGNGQIIAITAVNIFGSVLTGIFLGLLLTWLENFDTKIGNFLSSVITMILFAQTLAYMLNLNLFIISLTLGLTVTQASSKGRLIHANINDIGATLYAIFFVIAGTHIDIAGFFKEGASFIFVYIIIRVITSRVANIFFNNRLKDHDYSALPRCLLSHAGIAIALAMVVKKIGHGSSELLYQTILSSIFIFEIIGPLLLKQALKSENEVSLESRDQNYAKVRRLSNRSFLRIIRDFVTESLNTIKK